ncbi:MAG TPA: His-Xaa-Ser system protein HxsD [Myxococcota bacterium]|nr:His-Xaa-Ser system protein HxsD [Myxococcota bacterium]HRY94081.1 His-Xaa-Ser system protein HxsD [Myxococcota bacterium]
MDEKLFPRPVSVAAAYRFLDRCYIRLERAGKQHLIVQLKGKQKITKASLECLAEEFQNELLHQLLRHQVAERTAGLRDAIVGRALFSAEPAPTEAASPGGDSAGPADMDYLDDPLGIAVPWEEKYGEGQDKNGGGQGQS